ncbi:hypothetical protein C9J60_10555 [Streptomyces sp. A244]|nr:hypothetical protein C9J60_10555 [Streptomyces sp. A244]
MHLRDLLIRIAETYDPKAGTASGVSAQDLLREVEEMSDLPLPHGFVASGYGGKGSASSTPWIGVFGKAINTQAQEGLYLAYIFDATLASVTLTLQQGVTKLSGEYPKLGDRLKELKRRARHLRAGIEPELALHWAHTPAFRSKLERPRAYEAASVAARRYEIASMPEEEVLAEDLHVASLLLRDAAAGHRSGFSSQWRTSPSFTRGRATSPPMTPSTVFAPTTAATTTSTSRAAVDAGSDATRNSSRTSAFTSSRAGINRSHKACTRGTWSCAVPPWIGSAPGSWKARP